MAWLLLSIMLAVPPAPPAPPADTARDHRALKVSITAAESLAVTISGSAGGPTVVLIPGLFGSEFGFRKVVPPLNAAGYRTIVIEPLGIGASSRPPRSDYSLAAQANRIAKVLDGLAVTRTLLVTHALGASIGLRLAYLRPDLVRGLVSLDGGPSEAAVTATFRRLLKLVPWIKLFGGAQLLRRKTRQMLVSSSGDTTWVTDEVVDAYTAPASRDLDGTLLAYVAMARAREPARLAPRLPDVQCPVHLLVGGAPHGGNVTTADISLLRAALRAFVLDSIPGAGHYLQEERPDAVVAAVSRMARRFVAIDP